MKNDGRFVLHRHTRQGEPVHWDIMFEAGPSLETYRLNISPLIPGCPGIPAERIPDHHLRFLTYQGSVNNGTGTIVVEDSGSYQVLSESGRTRTIQLSGKSLKCTITVISAENDRQLFVFDCNTPG